MNATQPEAETEYSTRPRALRGSAGRARATLGLALTGCGLLLAAEFTPLFRVRTAARHPVLIRTVQTGPHHGWALVPIALLAAGLAALAGRPGAPRLRWLTAALLALVALGIALGADLPDTHATGLVGSPATGLHDAGAHVAIGLYLETLGAVVLLLAAGAGSILRPSGATRSSRETRGRPTARDRGLR